MPRKIREIRIEGNDAFITLTKGYTAVIDAADVPLICDSHWCAQVHHRPDGTVRGVYAASFSSGPAKLLHRIIAGTPMGMETDHRDGDGLNCRRSNLRNATQLENSRNRRRPAHNSSGVKGVSWHKQIGKWQAHIGFHGKKWYLGTFASLDDAAAAYAKASARLHGEFGSTG